MILRGAGQQLYMSEDGLLNKNKNQSNSNRQDCGFCWVKINKVTNEEERWKCTCVKNYVNVS